MVEVMTIMAISFKRYHSCTAAPSAPTLQQATADPRLRQRLLDTHRQVVWVSLLWDHCSFLLGPHEKVPEDFPLINDLNSYLKVFTGDKV